MEYQDFRDLANFVSQGQVDMDEYIDRKTGVFKGDKSKDKGFFESICANCHGLDGRMIDTTPLREVVLKNPWHAFHKIINGHPDEAMPALRVFGIDTLQNILTYVQSLPPET
jgi:thiosulfate dehydrogenase